MSKQDTKAPIRVELTAGEWAWLAGRASELGMTPEELAAKLCRDYIAAQGDAAATAAG